MPRIENVATALPPYCFPQSDAKAFVRALFSDYPDVDRLMPVFDNAFIEKRHFISDYDWYATSHTFTELNDRYISSTLDLSCQVIKKLLDLSQRDVTEIDAIIFISTTGISTPSIDARLFNILGFNRHIVRIPIWGLGCAGGAAGVARAAEYVTAHPDAVVLVLSVEISSLAFQRTLSKENLIAAALFGDGAGGALLIGDNVTSRSKLPVLPHILDSLSTTYPDTLDVMGWQITPDGFQVLLSQNIPTIVLNLVHENICELLQHNKLELTDINHYVTHPGGTKVLEAYRSALGLDPDALCHSATVLRENGNMSSCTVFFILDRFMQPHVVEKESYGILSALGPGFSSELVLMKWQ